GLVTGDTVTSVTLTSAGAAATATVALPGPNYAIVPSAAVGMGLSNYTITYNNGTLTVTSVAPSVTLATPTLTGQAFAVNTAISFAGSFTDPGSITGETYTATWTFDTATQAGTVSGGNVTTSRTFTATGVYDVKLTVTDSNSLSGTANTDNNGSAMRV